VRLEKEREGAARPNLNGNVPPGPTISIGDSSSLILTAFPVFVNCGIV